MVALVDAAMGYRVRNATYRKLAEVTDQVASRDLKQLVDDGLLTPVGQKRGRFYTASEALTRITGGRPQALKVEDPFETDASAT